MKPKILHAYFLMPNNYVGRDECKFMRPSNTCSVAVVPGSRPFISKTRLFSGSASKSPSSLYLNFPIQFLGVYIIESS